MKRKNNSKDMRKHQENSIDLVRFAFEATRLEEINILDIGCGCTENTQGCVDCFEPINARLFANLGANVIGVDLGRVYREPYRHIQANLVYKSLKQIMPKDFRPNIVLATSFFDSPALDGAIFSKVRSSEPDLDKIHMTMGDSFYQSPEWNAFLKKEKETFLEFARSLCRDIYDIMDDHGVFLVPSIDLRCSSCVDDVRLFFENLGFRYISDVINNIEAYGKF